MAAEEQQAVDTCAHRVAIVGHLANQAKSVTLASEASEEESNEKPNIDTAITSA